MRDPAILMVAVLAVGSFGCATTPKSSTTTYYREPSGSYSRPVYTQVQPPPQEDYNKKVIKQGLLGAATGAIAAETSGGKAGTGALVGAGTNVLGGALLDALTTPQAQQTQFVSSAYQGNQVTPNNDRVIRKYDTSGNIISEEVFTR